MKLSLRRRARSRTEPPTEPIFVQAPAENWRPVTEMPEVGMLIQLRAPTIGARTLRARYQNGFRGTHWLLALTFEDNSTVVRWIDVRHLTGWRYL
jgi:hypothetical protein